MPPRTQKSSGTKAPQLPKALQQLAPSVKDALQPLSVVERRFVMMYTSRARGNATLAMQLAGVQGTYSMLATKASIMFALPKVRKAVDAVLDSVGMTAAHLTASIAELTEVNPGPFTEWLPDGSIKVKVPDEETWQAHKHWIKGFKCDPESGKLVEIVLHDALAAKKEMAKIRKLYSDAPIFHLHMYLQGLPDDELLKQLDEARSTESSGERPLLPENRIGVVG